MLPIDLTGQRFGRLLVVEESEVRKTGGRTWLCRCDCGATTVVPQLVLRGGRSKSCGCLRREMGVKRGSASSKHGEAVAGAMTVEYRTWGSMIQRCTNKNHKQYPDYGGRGITICERWRFSYENFLADMGRRPDKFHSLDRIDNARGYEPENCRWATWDQQNNNRRQWGEGSKAQQSALENALTFDGESMPLRAWLDRAGTNYSTYWWRVKRGWDQRAAIFTARWPVGKRHPQTP
jgi:hypothetical protein